MIKKFKGKCFISNKKEYDKTQYPSAKLMLDISRSEYEREYKRSNTLDNKASLFVSAAIAVLTIIIPIIPFSLIIPFYRTASTSKIIFMSIILFVLFQAMVLCAIAIYNLSKAITVKDYTGVEFDNLNEDIVLRSPENQNEKELIEHFNQILTINNNVNNEKAMRIKLGFKYVISSIALLFVSTISLLILIGG